jgi:hypothetical protein
MRRLLRRTVELLNSCGARELSNLAHGLAKCRLVGLDVEAGALFAAVAEAAVRVGFGSFKPQELANTAWAFATAGHAAPALLDAIAAAAVLRLRDFNPQATLQSVKVITVHSCSGRRLQPTLNH